MSDFDYLYEKGLVDKSGMPTWTDEVCNSELQNEKYYIKLTPKKYLFDNGLSICSELQTREEVDLLKDADLKIQHDRYNIKDKYALKILYENRFIGYIIKNSIDKNLLNEKEINSLCFDDTGFIKDIVVKKENYSYFLEIRNEKQYFSNDFDKVEKSLYKDRNIKPLNSELETIQFVLKNRNKYSFNEKELDSLILRKNSIIINSSGKSLGFVIRSTFEIIEKVLLFTQKIFSPLFKILFK